MDKLPGPSSNLKMHSKKTNIKALAFNGSQFPSRSRKCPVSLQTPGWKECESGREAGAPGLLAVGTDSHPSALRTALSFRGQGTVAPVSKSAIKAFSRVERHLGGLRIWAPS